MVQFVIEAASVCLLDFAFFSFFLLCVYHTYSNSLTLTNQTVLVYTLVSITYGMILYKFNYLLGPFYIFTVTDVVIYNICYSSIVAIEEEKKEDTYAV
jgi:hypothetical protein